MPDRYIADKEEGPFWLLKREGYEEKELTPRERGTTTQGPQRKEKSNRWWHRMAERKRDFTTAIRKDQKKVGPAADESFDLGL